MRGAQAAASRGRATATPAMKDVGFWPSRHRRQFPDDTISSHHDFVGEA